MFCTYMLKPRFASYFPSNFRYETLQADKMQKLKLAKLRLNYNFFRYEPRRSITTMMTLRSEHLCQLVCKVWKEESVRAGQVAEAEV